MWMHGYGYYPIMGSGFSIVSVLFFIFFVVFVVLIIKAIARGNKETEQEDDREWKETDTALQILRERYAKGEITKRQYMDMKEDLM